MIGQAVVLCTPQRPIGGAPLVDALLFELGRHGIRRILLLAGTAERELTGYAQARPLKPRFGLEIEVAHDLLRAGERLDRSFLLLNGGFLVRHQPARSGRAAFRRPDRARGPGIASCWR